MKAHKFRAIRTECAEGHQHPSKIEAGKCDDLHDQQRRGEIINLIREPEYPIRINGSLVCKYVADFGYQMAESGLPVVLDVKGVQTEAFRLKKKLVEACYPGTVVTIWPPKIRKRRKK